MKRLLDIDDLGDPEPTPELRPNSLLRQRERPSTHALEFWLLFYWSGVLLTLLMSLAFLFNAWPKFVPQDVRVWLLLGIPPIVLPVVSLIYFVRYYRWTRRMLEHLRELVPEARTPSPHSAPVLLLLPLFGMYWKHRLLWRMNAAVAMADKAQRPPRRAGLRAGLWLAVAGYALIALSLTFGVLRVWRMPIRGHEHFFFTLPFAAGWAFLIASSLVLHQVQRRLTHAVLAQELV